MEEQPQDRGAIVPHDWLKGYTPALLTGLQGASLRAFALLVLMQFFGWRSNTVLSLKTALVEVKGRQILFHTSEFKSLGPGGLPMGILRLTSLPLVYNTVLRFVNSRRGHELLFAATDRPSEAAQSAFRLYCQVARVDPPTY